MHLIISSNRKSQDEILNISKNSSYPIFLSFRNWDNADEMLSNAFIRPNAVIIDEGENLEFIKKQCKKIKAEHPNIPIGVILNKSEASISLFRYVPEADEEIFSPFSSEAFIDFLQKLYPSSIPSVSQNLICTPKASYLLGYDMKLSPSENRIMIFLSIFNNLKLNANTICEVCLNIPEDKIANVRVLINRINKKAQNISSRSIILNSYEKGYYLNPDI